MVKTADDPYDNKDMAVTDATAMGKLTSVNGIHGNTAMTSSVTMADTHTPITFSNLPAEIRDNIYDFAAVNHRPSTRKHSDLECIPMVPTPAPGSRALCRPPALAQVSRAIRKEYLARHHLRYGTILPGMFSDRATHERWLELFGPSRVPLTRHFRIWIGLYDFDIWLKGGKRETKGKRTLFVEGPRGKPSNTHAFSPEKFGDLVESLANEDEDSRVYFTVENVREILKFLDECRWGTVPKMYMRF